MSRPSPDWKRQPSEKRGHTNCLSMIQVPAPKEPHNRPQSLSSDHSATQAVEFEWKPARRETASLNQSDSLVNEYSSIEVQEAVNQELIDLLRSQITRLLEENEKILTTLDDYREQIAIMRREQRESAPDLTMEQMALQTELGESRLREAELTIAFGELQDRISAIDRMIETDPEMEQFFNAVTISTTVMSRQKPAHRTSHSQASSPTVKDKRTCTSMRSYDATSRSACLAQPTTMDRQVRAGAVTRSTDGRDSHSSPYKKTNSDYNDQLEDHHRSGLESPQSDSGCSLNSHMTSEVTEPNMADDHDLRKAKREQFIATRMKSEQPRTSSYRDEVDLDEEFGEDRTFKNERPQGLVSLLRRSRSSAVDHQFSMGFRNELNSSIFPWDKDDGIAYNRHTDDTPTPTDAASRPMDVDNSTESEGSESKSLVGDRFNKLRASFRKSFGFGSSKPDFRMEAFAARQGEARALLSLRETRMELLRVQSRCQTLQRHVDRLEAVNSSRMEELEASVACDRELRQDIRGLQRRIFELEAEHREFKVNQRIKEMELMSKLAEANLRLSHVELTNQQAVVWSELNKAHEAASGLLTPTQPRQTGDSPNEGQDNVPRIHSSHDPRAETKGLQRTIITRENASPSVIKRRPTLDHSITRLQASRHHEDGEQTKSEFTRNLSHNDLSQPSGIFTPATVDEFHLRERMMDESIGSLSELRLKPDMSH